MAARKKVKPIKTNRDKTKARSASRNAIKPVKTNRDKTKARKLSASRKSAGPAPHTCFDRIVSPEAHAMRLRNFATVADAHGKTLSDLPELSADHPVHRAYMAVINSKKWPDGHELTCRFLDGEPAWQQKVQQKAKMWEQYANVKVSFVTTKDAQVRISFFADAGSWSALGTDCLDANSFPADQATINFGWLRDDTADDEYERVVVHEFGHALGCIHEHQSPNEKLDWNKAEVYKTFSGPPNNWDKTAINENILQKYSAKGISATVFDADSIMLYQFDASLFKDKKPTPLNMHLSDLDKSMIKQMYPPTAA